ncbi:MAG: hypothetical protein HYX26_08045 [Acidobacteriales bacterium]|nr:hypothetical protein [Terriglobales bacterium]
MSCTTFIAAGAVLRARRHRVYFSRRPMPQISDEFRFYFTLATLGAMVILSALVVYLSTRGLRFGGKKAEDPRFAGRDPRTLDQFYEAHYAAHMYPRAVVAEVVTRFAAAAQVPAQWLEPTDSFAGLGTADREECRRFAVDTALTLEEAERKAGAPLYSGKLATLDDYVRSTVLIYRLMSGAKS